MHTCVLNMETLLQMPVEAIRECQVPWSQSNKELCSIDVGVGKQSPVHRAILYAY